MSRDAKMFAPFALALAVSREGAHLGEEWTSLAKLSQLYISELNFFSFLNDGTFCDYE